MKHNKKKGFGAPAALAIGVVLIGGALYLYSQQKSAPSSDTNSQNEVSTPTTNTPVSSAPNVPAHTSDIKQYIDPAGNFAFSYSGKTFSIFPVSNLHVFGNQYTYPGIKMILAADVKLVGTQALGQGSGLPYTKTVDNTQGVSFAVINQSAENFANSSGFSGSSLKTATLAGKSVLSAHSGAEGSGVTLYYVPLSSSQVLVIQHTYEFGGAFTDAMFTQILGALVIK